MSSDIYNQLAIDDTYPIGKPTEICDCGKTTTHPERHRCVHCNHEGCAACMRLAGTDDAGLNEDWVCDDECELEWLKYLSRAEETGHRVYQDAIAKLIAAVRLRKAG
jgi:hypothetical protein